MHGANASAGCERIVGRDEPPEERAAAQRRGAEATARGHSAEKCVAERAAAETRRECRREIGQRVQGHRDATRSDAAAGGAVVTPPRRRKTLGGTKG